MLGIKRIKLCTICKENEALLLTKSLVTGTKTYLCTDCIIQQGEIYKDIKRFKEKEEPWTVK